MKTKSLGFTLVELLVALAIAGVVITIGAVSLNKFGSSQKIEEAKEGLISTLRLARNYAVTGQNVTGVGDVLNYVTVVVAADGNVTVYPNELSTWTYLNKDVSPAGVTMTVNTLRFASYDGKLVDSAGKSVAGAEFNITVGAGGEIEDPGTEVLKVKVSPSGLINE